MQKFLVLVLIASLSLAGCLQQANGLLSSRVQAAPDGIPLDEEGFAPRLFDGFVATTLDVAVNPTFNVHADVYLPDLEKPVMNGTPLPDQFPTILVMSPYFGDGQGGAVPGHPVYKWLVETMLPRGYAVVLADVAGMGGSGGCWDFMGPDEVASAAAMVNGIAEQPWSDGKVGMIGKSYDAMTQIMAMSAEAPALVTVVPVAPLTHAYAGLYMNGVHYGGGWMATTTAYQTSSLTPPGQSPDRYPGYAQSVGKTPACAGQNAAFGNDPSGAYNSYYQARDFRPAASQATASVFFMQGFLDAAVKPDNGFPYLNDLPTPTKVWLGHWGHDYANSTYAGREDMYLTIHRWFDHWLKGAANGIDQELGYDVQDSMGRWRHEARWPPADAQPLVRYLAADGTLAAAPAEEARATFGGPLDLAQIAQGSDDLGPAFTTGVLDAPLHLAGLPALNLTLTSTHPGGQVVARLYDVGGDAPRLVSQGAFNLLLAADATRATPVRPGEPVSIGFELYPTDYVVPAGHELVLTLGTQTRDTWFMPDPWMAQLTLVTGGEDGPRLTLPIVERGEDDVLFTACGIRIAKLVEGCYDETRRDVDYGEVA